MSRVEFGRYRARLLEELDVNGTVNQLGAWQELVTELRQVLLKIGLER